MYRFGKRVERRTFSKKCQMCTSAFSGLKLQKYCGKECYKKSQKQSKVKYLAKARPPAGPFSPVSCLTCGEIFTPKSRRNRFCKNPCRDKHHNRIEQQNKFLDRQTDDPILSCRVCQKPFKQSWPRQTAVTCGSKCSKRYGNSTYGRQKDKFIREHGIDLWRDLVKHRNLVNLARKEARQQKI